MFKDGRKLKTEMDKNFDDDVHEGLLLSARTHHSPSPNTVRAGD